VPTELVLTVRIVGSISVVEAAGEVDLTTSLTLDAALNQALLESPPTVVLDLTGVTFVDSSGLAMLVAVRKAARSKGGELRLVNPRPNVQSVLQVTGLDQVFPIFFSVDEATSLGVSVVIDDRAGFTVGIDGPGLRS
jgi:anti-sigma B factor antagonist